MKKVMVLGCGVQGSTICRKLDEEANVQKLSARTTVWQQQKLYAA